LELHCTRVGGEAQHQSASNLIHRSEDDARTAACQREHCASMQSDGHYNSNDQILSQAGNDGRVNELPSSASATSVPNLRVNAIGSAQVDVCSNLVLVNLNDVHDSESPNVHHNGGEEKDSRANPSRNEAQAHHRPGARPTHFFDLAMQSSSISNSMVIKFTAHEVKDVMDLFDHGLRQFKVLNQV
jgi:hypothetical protein